MQRFSAGVIPNLANRTLLVGRVLPQIHSPLASPTNNPESVLHRPTPPGVIVVRIPFLKFNDYFLRYFKKEHDLFATDPDNTAQEGDSVLLRRIKKPAKKDVEFELVEVVQRLGDVIDPMTGKSVVGHRYREHMLLIDEIYGKNKEGFDYSKAPRRGRLAGKRDFSYKTTYYKWHVFPKEDEYSSVS